MYIDPAKYSNLLNTFKPINESIEEEIKEPTIKEMIASMSPDEREKMQEYADSLVEIRKAMTELMNKAKSRALKEAGGNMMDKTLSAKPE